VAKYRDRLLSREMGCSVESWLAKKRDGWLRRETGGCAVR
jgi:hypothetical protein